MKVSRQKVDVLMARKSIESQKKLSEKSGVSRQSISYILNGRSCQPFVAAKIANALGVDVTEILED
ncbi:helix-turn-helix domain-containing protein [Frisingicoccus sp.]|uniref:helix-turn-helix domain-containing protein n=1 Tax=Frisingicoccus sp. TaxID=1918627 RepID=UPI003AB42B1E